MEILSGENYTSVDLSESINTDTTKVVYLSDFVSKVFFLNKEERFRAGIYIGYEGREWIDQAALILPTFDEE